MPRFNKLNQGDEVQLPVRFNLLNSFSKAYLIGELSYKQKGRNQKHNLNLNQNNLQNSLYSFRQNQGNFGSGLNSGQYTKFFFDSQSVFSNENKSGAIKSKKNVNVFLETNHGNKFLTSPPNEFYENQSSLSQKNKMLAIRLEYLGNIRKLRLIEYLKGASIQPEWMVISLLPVLPPDLRPIIANPRGYITGDINIHYQNIVYRNNMIERLSNVFWIPKKLVSLKQIFSWQKISKQSPQLFEKKTEKENQEKQNQRESKKKIFEQNPSKNKSSKFFSGNQPFNVTIPGYRTAINNPEISKFNSIYNQVNINSYQKPNS